MDDGWDLHAVVRSCTSISGTAVEEKTPTAMDLHEDEFYRLETVGNESKLVSYPNLGENPSSLSGGLEEIYKEGCVQPLPITAAAVTAAASVSFDGAGFGNEQPSIFSDSISFSIKSVDSQSTHPRKRRNKAKKTVVEFREEELGNDHDGWAWRKYGQKPIKGSPYPRNYYRCSTTKDCLARKQVERSPIDPSNFIVSYSGDHLHSRPTHLSSLAGSTRSSKFNTMSTKQAPHSCSSPPSASSFSPTSLKDDEIEMNDGDIRELVKNY